MSALRARARLHRPRRDREVRRLLPRPRRRACSSRPARASSRSALPDSPGRAGGLRPRDTLVAPYNDLAAVEPLFEAHGAEIAAVIVEPVAGNMGVVPPAPGFLEGLRALCDQHGALLIFDEVITGFRVGRGGAQARYGVTPDLTLPRQDRRRRPAGRRVRRAARRDGAGRAGRAGLPGRHALGQPAGDGGRAGDAARARRRRSTRDLERRTAPAGRRADAAAARGRRAASRATGSARWRRSSSPTGPVDDYDAAMRADRERYGAALPGAARPRRLLPARPVRGFFTSRAHGDDDIDRTIEAASAAFASLADDRRPSASWRRARRSRSTHAGLVHAPGRALPGRLPRAARAVPDPDAGQDARAVRRRSR